MCVRNKVFNVVRVQTETYDLCLEQITQPEPRSSFIAQVRDHFSQFESFDKLDGRASSFEKQAAEGFQKSFSNKGWSFIVKFVFAPTRK